MEIDEQFKKTNEELMKYKQEAKNYTYGEKKAIFKESLEKLEKVVNTQTFDFKDFYPKLKKVLLTLESLVYDKDLDNNEFQELTKNLAVPLWDSLTMSDNDYVNIAIYEAFGFIYYYNINLSPFYSISGVLSLKQMYDVTGIEDSVKDVFFFSEQSRKLWSTSQTMSDKKIDPMLLPIIKGSATNFYQTMALGIYSFLLNISVLHSDEEFDKWAKLFDDFSEKSLFLLKSIISIRKKRKDIGEHELYIHKFNELVIAQMYNTRSAIHYLKALIYNKNLIKEMKKAKKYTIKSKKTYENAEIEIEDPRQIQATYNLYEYQFYQLTTKYLMTIDQKSVFILNKLWYKMKKDSISANLSKIVKKFEQIINKNLSNKTMYRVLAPIIIAYNKFIIENKFIGKENQLYDLDEEKLSLFRKTITFLNLHQSEQDSIVNYVVYSLSNYLDNEIDENEIIDILVQSANTLYARYNNHLKKIHFLLLAAKIAKENSLNEKTEELLEVAKELVLKCFEEKILMDYHKEAAIQSIEWIGGKLASKSKRKYDVEINPLDVFSFIYADKRIRKANWDKIIPLGVLQAKILTYRFKILEE